MSHSFSMAYIKGMEVYLDQNIKLLKDNIATYCSSGQAFDLTQLLHFYVIDVLGELAFSQSFGVQETRDEGRIPPVKEHSLLSAATGAWPAMTFRLKRWLPMVPLKSLRALFQGRQACADLAAKCVERRLQDLQEARDDEVLAETQRKDILTNLILARHPDTGERLTKADLETEAFGFMYGTRCPALTY